MTRTDTSVTNLTITAERLFSAIGEGGGGRFQAWKLTLTASGGAINLEDIDLSNVVRSDEELVGVTGLYDPTTDKALATAHKPSTRMLFAQEHDGTVGVLSSGTSQYATMFLLAKANSQE